MQRDASRCTLANPITALDQCFGWENLFLLPLQPCKADAWDPWPLHGGVLSACDLLMSIVAGPAVVDQHLCHDAEGRKQERDC